MSSSTAIEGATRKYRKPRSPRAVRGAGRGSAGARGRVARASRFMGSAGGRGEARPPGPALAARLPTGPISSSLLRVRSGLGGPRPVDGLLLLRAHLLRDLVPLRRHVV